MVIWKAPEPIPEKTTVQYEATLYKHDGNPLTLAELTTITARLYNMDAARTDIYAEKNVKNANGGTYASNGLFKLIIDDEENAMVDSTKSFEVHRCLLHYTYDSGAKGGHHVVEIRVLNLDKVA